LGHLPKKGERIGFDDLHFKVLQADSRRIKTLELELPEEYILKP
jgi:Mg2+/Co2+ transporter CorC